MTDIETYKDNPWGIYEVIVDVDTPAADICENVSFSYQFFTLAGGIDLFEFPDEQQVCGLEFHPNKQIFDHDVAEGDSQSDNNFGMFGCSSVTVSGNVYLDSYDWSEGLYGGDNVFSNGNIYSNGSVDILGHATIVGNVSAPSITVGGSAYVSGEQTTGDYDWDCLKTSMDEVSPVVQEMHNNDRIGNDSSGSPPFSPEDSLNFRL